MRASLVRRAPPPGWSCRCRTGQGAAPADPDPAAARRAGMVGRERSRRGRVWSRGHPSGTCRGLAHRRSALSHPSARTARVSPCASARLSMHKRERPPRPVVRVPMAQALEAPRCPSMDVAAFAEGRRPGQTPLEEWSAAGTVPRGRPLTFEILGYRRRFMKNGDRTVAAAATAWPVPRKVDFELTERPGPYCPAHGVSFNGCTLVAPPPGRCCVRPCHRTTRSAPRPPSGSIGRSGR